MALTPPYEPNAEMAMQHWLRALPGQDPTKVATTVPGDPAVWASTGFVTVQAVGGTPGAYVPRRSPVVAVSAWGVTLNSPKAPWGQTQAHAEALLAELYDADRFPYLCQWPSYRSATILAGRALTEPRKVPGSEAGFAQVSFDVSLTWVTVR